MDIVTLLSKVDDSEIRKEMLESNQLRESAIYEGDERWSFLNWDTFEKLISHLEMSSH